jgi:hypothetical protein
MLTMKTLFAAAFTAILTLAPIAALAQDRGTDAAKTNIHWQH